MANKCLFQGQLLFPEVGEWFYASKLNFLYQKGYMKDIQAYHVM
jgi:hypothetical protein